MLPHDTRAQSGATPDDTHKGGIYIIRLSDTHYYGGRTTNFKRRWADHHRKLRAGRHYNLRMQRVFNRYGRFEPEVVEALHPDDCPEAEQAWLDANFGKPGCVNLVASSRGGMAGWEVTPETRAKLSATLRARPDLIEKARASLARNRVFATKESYRRAAIKISVKMRGRKQPPETVARRAAALRGRKLPPETLARMSESGKRRAAAMPTSHGAETRALISAQQLGRMWVNNGVEHQKLLPQEAEALLREGWVRGSLGRTIAGMISMIDQFGAKRRVQPERVSECLGEGWTFPPPRKPSYVPVPAGESQQGHRGSVWVRRQTPEGLDCRRVSSLELEAYLAEGWERGARPRTK
jgi:group I intron endonuclease